MIEVRLAKDESARTVYCAPGEDQRDIDLVKKWCSAQGYPFFVVYVDGREHTTCSNVSLASGLAP